MTDREKLLEELHDLAFHKGAGCANGASCPGHKMLNAGWNAGVKAAASVVDRAPDDVYLEDLADEIRRLAP